MQWPVADLCYEPGPSQEFIRDVYQTFVEIDTKETGFMTFEVDHGGMQGVGIGWTEWVGWRFVMKVIMGNDHWPRGIRPSARSSARRVSFDVGVSWQRFKEFSHSLAPESRMSRHGRILSYIVLFFQGVQAICCMVPRSDVHASYISIIYCLHLHMYIYLEPKLHLFWLEKTFWRQSRGHLGSRYIYIWFIWYTHNYSLLGWVSIFRMILDAFSQSLP